MTANDEPRRAVFIPALFLFLAELEKRKGTPLTRAEVEEGRDNAPSLLMSLSDAAELEEKRGYPDLDSDNVWEEWEAIRKEMGAGG